MTFLDLKGREKKLKNLRKYLVDWHGKTRSKGQSALKAFLYPYWHNDVVAEEMPLVGSLMRFDIINLTKKIAVEFDGRAHHEFVKHFHKTRNGFLRHVKRDLQKEDFLERNNITLIRVRDEKKELTYDYFLSQGVEL
jgi:hypothetical protein